MRKDAVLALSNTFEALLYFDEVHLPRTLMTEQFAETCAELASKYAEPPFDDSRTLSKIDEGVFVLGDGMIGGYEGALTALFHQQGLDVQDLLSHADEIEDAGERQIVRTMLISHLAVQANLSGAKTCLLPDYLSSEDREASVEESSPIVDFVGLPTVDVSRTGSTVNDYKQEATRHCRYRQ